METDKSVLRSTVCLQHLNVRDLWGRKRDATNNIKYLLSVGVFVIIVLIAFVVESTFHVLVKFEQ